jgi:hypothetical protein
VSAARLLLAFCMVFTYPMECFVTRHCLLSIVHRIISDREKAKAKLIQSGIRGVTSGGVNAFGDIEEQNPMMKRAPSVRKNTDNTSTSVSGQRYIEDGMDPRSRHKDGCAYDSGEERPGGATRRDSLEILLSTSEDSRCDKNAEEVEREREKDSACPTVIYFNAEDSQDRERRSDEDMVRSLGKGKDRQKGKEKEKKRSSGVMKSENASVLSGNSNNNSKHSSSIPGNSRDGSKRNSPETLFTVLDTKENDSDNDDVTSNDSLSSPCSVSTARTACSAVNEKSELEEETKSSVLNDGRRKQTSSSDEIRMKNENLKNDKGREGSRSASPMQNGEKVRQTDGSHKDTVFINVNNGFSDQVSENKSDVKNNAKADVNYDFDYDVFHPVSLLNTQEEKDKESIYRFSRVCPCPSSCPCGVKNPFSDRQNTARVAVTLLLWGSSVAIALLFRDLGMVLAFTGAVCVIFTVSIFVFFLVYICFTTFIKLFVLLRSLNCLFFLRSNIAQS